jgi:hypothetical protein
MHYEMRSTYLTLKRIDLLKIDSDVLLFKALCGVIFLSIAWPLAFLGYLVTVYGLRILAWQ